MLCSILFSGLQSVKTVPAIAADAGVIGLLLVVSRNESLGMQFTAPELLGSSSRMLERMTAAPVSLSVIATGFGALTGKMGVSGVSLREALSGSAFSISLSGQGVVAMSPKLAGSLSSDETDAVLAHELSHIKNGDSAAKGLAKLARVAFPFDPVLRLVEAAVHRERELWADRVSVEFTGKPLALASAIVKANSESSSTATNNLAGLFAGGSGHGLLSLYPNLERRVDILLELARRMEIANSPLVVA